MMTDNFSLLMTILEDGSTEPSYEVENTSYLRPIDPSEATMRLSSGFMKTKEDAIKRLFIVLDICPLFQIKKALISTTPNGVDITLTCSLNLP